MRLISLFFLFSISVFVHSQEIWTEVNNKGLNLKSIGLDYIPSKAYSLNMDLIKSKLAKAPLRNFKNQSKTVIKFPNIDGKMESYYVEEASNFAPELANAFPDIKSYRGVAVNNRSVIIAFSVSELGIKTMRLSPGAKTTFIEPITKDNKVYGIYEYSERSKKGTFKCLTKGEAKTAVDITNEIPNKLLDSDDKTLRTFRLAISVTGEYSQYFGGTIGNAMAAINATMTRINALYETELAINMMIVADNNTVVFTNPTTDPYSPASKKYNWSEELQSTLNKIIGAENYDIGHLFGATGSGGNAGCIGCVCEDSRKGSGYTSPADKIPEGVNFDIDFVAHEMGHQFGANHTFSRNEKTGVNAEPGSGSTIMGYAGITNKFDIQPHSDAYFHSLSIGQITTNVKEKYCPIKTPISNSPPIANAGEDFTIPIATPFKLKGSASDPDGRVLGGTTADVLSYCWEQIDSSTSYSYSFADPMDPNVPLFRSYPPSINSTRFFPVFSSVLLGNLYSNFESLSRVSRKLNFMLQVRDQVHPVSQTASDKMSVTVDASNGAFKITKPASENETLYLNRSYTITWDVAKTNLAPFNSPNVNIYLSRDEGKNFSIIAENTPNDGTETIKIPSGKSSTNAYFLIESVGNVFYAVSPKFKIDYAIDEVGCNSSPYTGLTKIPDGIGADYGNYIIGFFNNESISADHIVDEISVKVDIAHTYIGDLQIDLISPSGTIVSLWNRKCSGSDNLNITFEDNASPPTCGSPTVGKASPYTPLSVLKGESVKGIWKLRVRDGYVFDLGVINSASLELCSTYKKASSLRLKDELEADNNFNIYPNPSKGIYNIKNTLKGSKLKFKVFNMNGQIVKIKENNKSNSDITQIDLSGYSSGVYILEIINGNKIVRKKLIKK